MMKLFVIGCLILGLTGCGVVPAKVQYAEYPNLASGSSAGDVSGYQFRHRRSVIKIEYEKDAGGLQATAVPHERSAGGSYTTLYRVWGADDYSSTTQLKVSYIDNTKLIDELQVTTKDNIADTISKVGAVVAALVPAATSVVSGEKKAIEFKRTMVDPVQPGIDQWTKDLKNEGYCVRLKDVVSESSLSLQKYVSDGLGKWQGTFPVQACAAGVVEVAQASSCDRVAKDNIIFSSWITFADADKVLPMGLPSSGTLKMNSVCGASVTEADKQDRRELLTYLSTVMTQIQSISAAWKTSKTEATTTGSGKKEAPKTGK